MSYQNFTDIQEAKPTSIHLTGRRDTCSSLEQDKLILNEIPGLLL